MKQFDKILLYITVFTTGAAVLVLEILGTRIISPFYGATIFVWSSLITVALGSLTLGYFFGGRLVDTYPKQALLFQSVFLAAAFILLIFKLDQLILPFSDQFGIRFGPLVASFLLFAPSFAVLGSVTPIAIRISTKELRHSGATAGHVFAVSTVGSVFGGLLAGFFLLPAFSLTHIFLALAAVLVVVAIIGLVLGKHPVLPLLSLVILAFFIPKYIDTGYTATTILSHKNSFYGDIKVTGGETQPCLHVDGSNQGCVNITDRSLTDSVFFMQMKELMSALPVDSRVLVLGLGAGAIPVLAPEGIIIETVEIDPAVVDVAHDYFELEPTERRMVFVDDARSFVRRAQPNQYDLIIEDVSLGSHVPYYLFSQESLRDMKNLLKPDGLLVSHIGIGLDDTKDLFAASIIKTFNTVFGQVEVYSTNPTLFSNFIIYAFQGTSELSGLHSHYYPHNSLVYKDAAIVTDDKNPLDYHYLPYAEIELANSKNIGNQILYTR